MDKEIINMNKLLTLFVLFLSVPYAHSYPSGMPVGAAPCLPGGSLVFDSGGDTCVPTNPGNLSGQWMYAPGQPWSTSAHSRVGYWVEYPPHSGKFMMRAHRCEVSHYYDSCTMSKSVDTIDSHYVFLDASLKLNESSPDFGGAATAPAPLPFSSKACYTLVDEYGAEYSSYDKNSCSDADRLPNHPVKCNLGLTNLNVSIDVQRGQLMPSATQGRGVTKQLQMTCEATASASFKISLSANKQLEIENGTAIGTSTAGLGIALYYNDKLFSPGTDLSAEFVPGTTPINLEFVPVRDPTIPVNKISTGDFSADAVLVMTEQ